MLTGKQFKLLSPAVAFEMVDGDRTAATLPAGAILTVTAGPTKGDRMIDVLWQGRAIIMFAIDLDGRGIGITGAGL